ncbi:Telomere length regulation protein elg1 [Escovopsis weberi]|uniref:Telomere length regulation protein elg1 n=1 Tax=Escovopsis weberi TaxID=150374 RepID=A0A0M8N5D8_ESCWE|nr:Telomere length regulation protein elg1 [Escovopsis weberi]
MRGGNLAPGQKNAKRLANAILLSGPHGCGKTATVYAVARELGFEVFEINSSSRRSGKDILEKVGDMTRNHLVQQNRADPTSIDVDEAGDEVKCGKQGMMTAFFKPKEVKGENKEAAPKTRGKKQQNDEGADRESRATSGKAHKQSLILLEEVDILFEEDKQFWATLMGLIAQSKRPFIMTCNEEELVPIQSLSLHGIFRFSPVPSHLAADLCILIAANEGHALRRPAVEALYHSRGDDLRATITELNYWCQIGVGDRRGGFDWFYLRWPRGCDLDEDGDVVRVVSEDTYCEGMGWMSRDAIATASDPLDAEEETIRQAWDHWQCDVGGWNDTDGLRSWAAQAPQPSKPRSRLSLLAAFDSYCSAMSDADLCASRAHGTQLHEMMDATHPDLPASRRDDFITGQALLDAQPLTRQASANKAISTTLRSLARETLSSPTAPPSGSPSSKCRSRSRALQPLDEAGATSILGKSFRARPRPLVRYDLAVAFDPIAIAPKGAPATHLDPSVFDRPLLPIVLDVAPWVRGIVLHDHRLMQRRLRLSNLLGEGPGRRKRMRSTRSALSALEGGERHAMKRDRWFGDALGVKWVMGTAGEGWTELVLGEEETTAQSSAQSPASDELAAA